MQVTPRTLAGFVELLPNEQIVFDKMMNTVKKTMELNGLVSLDTPVLELSEVLLAKAGGETEKQVYRFTKGDTDMTMRFDLTVPLAKYVALHKNELSFPFRRYQIGKVYRGERAQRGRLREFYQCDCDIIGDGELSLYSDAEVISVLSQIYKNLDLPVVIRVSNRKILSGIFAELGLEEKAKEISQVLDKLEKIGEESARKELISIDKKAERVLDIVLNQNSLSALKKLKINSEVFKTGLEEMETVLDSLKFMDVKNRVEFDLRIIRGLDYYTGTVFEANLEGEAVSVGGGGRYDNLTSYFSKDKMPGVGFGMGLSRVFDLLKQKLAFGASTLSKVALIPFDETVGEAFELSSFLRENDIPNEVYYFNKSFKAKMNRANRAKVPYIIVVGEDEVKSGVFGLKNMETGEERKLEREELIEALK